MSSPIPKRTRNALLSQATHAGGAHIDKHQRMPVASPFRAMRPLDSRFDKLSLALTESLSKKITEEMQNCEKRIIAEFNKNIAETEAKLLNEMTSSVDSLRSEFQSFSDRITAIEQQCTVING